MSIPLVRRSVLLIALTSISCVAFAQKATQSEAATWPTKAVRIMVGFPGGSTPDLVARTIAEPLSKALGQPVIVENRPGAGGNIAADVVAKATDNHTIGVMINGNMTIAKLLNPATPFDPLKDLAPISLIGTAPLLLTAPANAPGNNAQDFLVAARNAGNKWSYGTPGVGTVGHIGMELLKTRTNIDPVHVPYPGNPQVINALIGFQLEIWTAAAGPASMPKPIVNKLSSMISEISRSPEVRQKLFQQGWQVAGTSSEGLANRVKADTALLGGVIQMRGIKAQ